MHVVAVVEEKSRGELQHSTLELLINKLCQYRYCDTSSSKTDIEENEEGFCYFCVCSYACLLLCCGSLIADQTHRSAHDGESFFRSSIGVFES